jgi:hypothetical protein
MKQKKQITVLTVLLLTAGIVWFWYFERDRPTVAADAVAAAQNYQLLSVENPQLHKDEVERARKTEYKSSGRNIFSEIAPLPPSRQPDKVAASARRMEPQLPPIPPPPTLPANMKFFGYGTVPNGTIRRAFFTDGEDVYIVSEGEVFLSRFRILKVNNANLEFEEISSGRRNTMMLEEQGTSPSP